MHYTRLDDADNSGSLIGEIQRLAELHKIESVRITRPGEWRLLDSFDSFASNHSLPITWCDDTRFLCTQDEFEQWASSRKQLRMEYFYRDMRRRTGLLMDDEKPAGGRWNFDSENRKPPATGLDAAPPRRFKPDAITKEVITLVQAHCGDHFGRLEPFWFAVTRKQALTALRHFIKHSLPQFGDYQDAMLSGERFLFHSVISHYLNAGLLDAKEICVAVEKAWKAGTVPLNAAEGYIRQIIGWREYVRGIYWLKMPAYRLENALQHTRNLPEFYWNGDTRMHCVQQCVEQTRDEAYAHHIQRLMVTGNFALLAGIDPVQVHEWYLAVYADAYEWVELPNTLGMSQFADGGLLGSKPYVASGNYINKMSDYCRHCEYSVKQKAGPEACPFNYLYWDFIDRHRDKLQSNHRMAQTYRSWDRMSDERQTEVREDAARYLGSLS